MIGFCVMGGIFAEGIDLKREALIGVFIVGTGLPQISNEREILKQFYQEREGAGFEYAFRYPGMNKVLQAAGRVIRISWIVRSVEGGYFRGNGIDGSDFHISGVRKKRGGRESLEPECRQ